MKRMIPILLMMTLLLTGCAVPKPATEANTYRQITMQEAVEMMEKEENYIILDVRTHEEFAAGHIPGATFAHEPCRLLPRRESHDNEGGL